MFHHAGAEQSRFVPPFEGVCRMSIGNIVESAKPAGKRTSYGIIIRVAGVAENDETFPLNEWGLTESDAKTVHEILVASDNAPFTEGGLTFSRREPSTLSARLAARKAGMVAGK
jgi:hypothetical protein